MSVYEINGWMDVDESGLQQGEGYGLCLPRQEKDVMYMYECKSELL